MKKKFDTNIHCIKFNAETSTFFLQDNKRYFATKKNFKFLKECFRLKSVLKKPIFSKDLCLGIDWLKTF